MKTRPFFNFSIFLLCCSVCRCGPVDVVAKNITPATTKESIVPVPEPTKQSVSKTVVAWPDRNTNTTIAPPTAGLEAPKTITKSTIRNPTPGAKDREEFTSGGQITINKSDPIISVTTITQTSSKPARVITVEQKSIAPPKDAPISSTISTSVITNASTTTTTTTTTPKPKKPTITYSVEDEPSMGNVTRGKLHDRTAFVGKLDVEEPEQPIAQPSLDMSMAMPPIHKDYVIPILAMIFAVPIIMGAIIVSFRRLRDYWSTRHYRRMDFLVDGMYND